MHTNFRCRRTLTAESALAIRLYPTPFSGALLVRHDSGGYGLVPGCFARDHADLGCAEPVSEYLLGVICAASATAGRTTGCLFFE